MLLPLILWKKENEDFTEGNGKWELRILYAFSWKLVHFQCLLTSCELYENILLVTFKAMLTLYWIAVVPGRHENHTRYCFCSHKRMVISVGMVSVTRQNCAMPTVSGASHIR